MRINIFSRSFLALLCSIFLMYIGLRHYFVFLTRTDNAGAVLGYFYMGIIMLFLALKWR